MAVDQFLDTEVPEVFDVLGVLAGGFEEEGGDTGDKGAVSGSERGGEEIESK